MKIECPCYHTPFIASMKESLEPYVMTLQITPGPGRLIQAKTVAGTLDALADMLVADGNEMGHETTVHVHDLSVDDDGAVKISVTAVPVARAAAQEKGGG